MSNAEDPRFKKESFVCPRCGVNSQQHWTWHGHEINFSDYYQPSGKSYFFSKCETCKELSIWQRGRLIYPLSSPIEPINPDAPKEVIEDYNEAKAVLCLSPKASNALLRLALQKLCVNLGAKKDSLDKMIGQLVAEKGLSPKIQSAMDAIRIYGNDSVHIGEINDSDTQETAEKLFRMINIIIQTMITDNKTIDGLMSNVSDSQKEHIKKRDSRSK